MSVTNPGDQSDVSGSAITPVPLVASDTSSTATLVLLGHRAAHRAVDRRRQGRSPARRRRPGTYPVTVDRPRQCRLSAQASFTWTITNTVTVTNPGDQVERSRACAITPCRTASDSVPSATLSFSDNGTLPAGLSIDAGSGAITGTPTTAGSYSVTITVTDSDNFAAQVTFNWTDHQHGVGDQPRRAVDASGAAISPLPVPATDSSSVATLTYSATGLPDGLSIDPTTGTITGTPTTAGTYSVTVTATDDAGFTGSASFSWTITNTVSVTNPGTQTNISGTAISPLSTRPPTPRGRLHRLVVGHRSPPGLSINPAPARSPATRPPAAPYPVTVTATDNDGFSGSASFTWNITNTVSVTTPGNQTSPVGSSIRPLRSTQRTPRPRPH